MIVKTIDIIPSKSYAHRELIAAALAGKGSVLCDYPSDDINATRACVKALADPAPVLPCGESGSTLRFLLPIAGALGKKARFETRGRLTERPLSPLYEELAAHGMKLGPQGTSPLETGGMLRPGQYTIPGNVSSQFITGLLMALPLLAGDSSIRITGNLESAGYVDITLDVLRRFGILWDAEKHPGETIYRIAGPQKYQSPGDLTVEGDWSGAAFWICAGAIGSEPLGIRGLDMDSCQGDRRIVDIARAFGAEVSMEQDILVTKPSRLVGQTIDVSDVPDLAPAIAVLGAFAEGETWITGAGRLRLKESDRIRSIVSCLRDLGADAEEGEDRIRIQGASGSPLSGGCVDGAGDHRIVMMAAVMSLKTDRLVIINGKNAVAKSYPGFFQVMKELGIDGNVR